MREELNALLVKHYPFTIHRVRPFPQGWELETGHGHFLLQSHPAALRQKEGWLKRVFAALATNARIERETDMAAAIFPLEDGSHGFEFADRFYYVTGRLPIINHRLDTPYLARSLSAFHVSTANALQGRKRNRQTEIMWPRQWQRQLNLFEYYRERMVLQDDEPLLQPVVRFLLYNYTYLCQLGETATIYWNHAACRDAYRQSMEHSGIAYTNFDGNQAVLCAGGRVQFIHPYTWVEDSRVRDIAQYVKNDMYLHGWQPERAVQFIEAYHSAAPLTAGEFALIYSMLVWPGKWIKWAELALGKRYRTGGETQPLPDPETLEQTMLSHENMLRQFPGLIEDRFGVPLPKVTWLADKN